MKKEKVGREGLQIAEGRLQNGEGEEGKGRLGALELKKKGTGIASLFVFKNYAGIWEGFRLFIF